MRISDWSSDVCSSDLRIAESATGSRAKIAMADSDLPSLVVMGRPKNGIAPEASGGVCAMGVARSEEHTSELQSLMRISYAVFCLKKKKITQVTHQCSTCQKDEQKRNRESEKQRDPSSRTNQ